MDKGRPALFSLQRNVTESLLSFSVPLMTLGDNSVSPCRFVRDRAGPGGWGEGGFGLGGFGLIRELSLCHCVTPSTEAVKEADTPAFAGHCEDQAGITPDSAGSAAEGTGAGPGCLGPTPRLAPSL